LGLVVGP